MKRVKAQGYNEGHSGRGCFSHGVSALFDDASN